MKSVAIIQSSYIPWKGYFDIINMVDEFILFDDVQYTKRDWRSRNRIKTASGLQWLTIPVVSKGRYTQRIDEVQVADQNWAKKHWNAIAHSYANSRYFDQYRDPLRDLYAQAGKLDRLSSLNHLFISALCHELGITTRLTWSSDYRAHGTKTDRLLSLCQLAGATRYLSGPSARAYIDKSSFEAAGIELVYMNYDDYPTYRQLHGPFDHRVSVIDLLMNEGPNSPSKLLSFRRDNDADPTNGPTTST